MMLPRTVAINKYYYNNKINKNTMRVDLDKNLDKDAFNNIKTAIGYPPKSPLSKISSVNFCKLAKITKN